MIDPDKILAQAKADNNGSFTEGEMKLLLSGVTALRERREKPLNKREMLSVRGLVAFVAHRQNLSESSVWVIVKDRFIVQDKRNLPSRSYQEIVEFLVDFEIKIN